MSTIDWIRPSGSLITTKDTEEMIAHAESQGWKVKQETPLKKSSESGEKKSVAPSKYQLHKISIKSMDSPEEIRDYMKLLGLPIDVRGNLKAVKSKALHLIRSQDDNSNSNN